jgi:hypothetical protein
MWQFTSRHKALQELGVHPIEPQDQHFLPWHGRRLRLGLANDQPAIGEGTGKPRMRQQMR